MGIYYQTLENRDNVDEVEANGPFPGKLRDRWLGPGYYYWDTLLNSAHFWGRVSYVSKGKEYIIARSKIDFPSDKLLNLLEPETVQKFNGWVREYEKTFPANQVTVEKVIVHIRSIMGESFQYEAIKALFIDCINHEDFQSRIYMRGGRAYLDLLPPVQVCVLDKKVVGPDNFKVIFPEKYDEEADVF